MILGNNTMIENILAKNKENGDISLIDHSISVANIAKELIEKITDDKRIISLVILSSLFHDIGKVSSKFQKHLLDNNCEDKYIPHNILSASIIEKYMVIEDDLRGMGNLHHVIRSILYHHPTQFYKIDEYGKTIDYDLLRTLLSDEDEKNILFIYEELSKIYETYNLSLKIKKNNELSYNKIDFSYFKEDGYSISCEDNIFFIINNVVKFADLIASSGNDYNHYINRYNNENIEFIKPSFYDDRFDTQVNIANELYNYKMSVFNSQTGFGKTMLGIKYLLSNNKKGYWICPRNTIAEGIYKTICKEIDVLNIGNKVKVGLLLTNEWIKGGPDADIIVTNIDNFIRPSLKADANVFCYNMLYCNCIFDEFHEFIDDEAIMASFVTILRARNKIKNGKTLLLSATPISNFYKEFEKSNEFRYIKYDYQPILNRKIKFSYGESLDFNDYKNKNYFISVNTVKKAQDVYTENCCDNIIHARFTEDDLLKRMNLLFNEHGKNKNITTSWVGTNIISTGIDVSFNNMIVSWPTPERFIQAGGRCNRWDECKEIPIWHIVKDEKDFNEKCGVDAFTNKDIARDFYYFLINRIKNNKIITLGLLYKYRDEFYESCKSSFDKFYKGMLVHSFKNLSNISYEYSKYYDNTDNIKYISNKCSLRKSGDIESFYFKVKYKDTDDFIEKPIQGDNRMIIFDKLSENKSLKYTVKAIKIFDKDKKYFKNKYQMNNCMKNNSKLFNFLLKKAKCSETPYLICNNYFYDNNIGLFCTK